MRSPSDVHAARHAVADALLLALGAIVAVAVFGVPAPLVLVGVALGFGAVLVLVGVALGFGAVLVLGGGGR